MRLFENIIFYRREEDLSKASVLQNQRMQMDSEAQFG